MVHGTVTIVQRIIQNEPHFHVVCEMCRAVGVCVEGYAKTLEVCWCHHHIWQQKKKSKRRRDELESLIGYSHCVWKGRQGPCFFARGVYEFLSDCANCTSERLDAWLGDLSCDDGGRDYAGELLRKLQVCRNHLVEALRAKLAFCLCLPYSLIGAFWCECGGIMETCKDLLREVFKEFDAVVDAGRPVHRVARRILDVGSRCRVELELWLASSAQLREFPVAYTMLLQYALCSLVERAIEGAHAIIKRIGASAPVPNLPYICARVREDAAFRMLRSNIEFRNFVTSSW